MGGVVNKIFGLPEPSAGDEQSSRMMGLRNVALAHLAYQTDGAERRRIYQVAAAMFVADTAVTALHSAQGKIPLRAAVMMGGTTALLAALSFGVASA